jgi:hypothetical protein
MPAIGASPKAIGARPAKTPLTRNGPEVASVLKAAPLGAADGDDSVVDGSLEDELVEVFSPLAV